MVVVTVSVVTVVVVVMVVVMVVFLCSDPDMPATAGMVGALLIMSGASEITVSSLCILFCFSLLLAWQPFFVLLSTVCEDLSCICI